MVQFLSIIFFSWIYSIFVGFFKSSRFFVSLCIYFQLSLLHTCGGSTAENGKWGTPLRQVLTSDLSRSTVSTLVVSIVSLFWIACLHGRAHHYATCRGDAMRVWRVVLNILQFLLNRQRRTVGYGCLSQGWVCGFKPSHSKNIHQKKLKIMHTILSYLKIIFGIIIGIFNKEMVWLWDLLLLLHYRKYSYNIQTEIVLHKWQ